MYLFDLQQHRTTTKNIEIEIFTSSCTWGIELRHNDVNNVIIKIHFLQHIILNLAFNKLYPSVVLLQNKTTRIKYVY